MCGMNEEKKGGWWELVKIVGVSLLIAFSVRYFIAQPFIVRGASMEPNFEDREYLVIDELSFYLRQPERGEVLVFRYPRDPRQFFIKRVIGLPGEKVEVKNGRIKIYNDAYPQGFLLEENYLDPPGRPTHPNLSLTLGSEEYFMLGDNRDFSSDSRVWGPLQRKYIVGRVLFRAWPPNKLGLVSE